MKVRVLGCSGGIGGHHLRTTSMLVDRDILIDAGTGVGDLSLDELAAIDHVFLTHSHLDHIAALPLMVDSVADRRNVPLIVYAIPETLTALRRHIFNWQIWPDFSEIPSREAPALQYREIAVGEAVLLNGRKIAALPVEHSIPSVGYLLDSGQASLAFSGDMTSSDRFWQALNGVATLRYLLIETAFSNREIRLAELSRHLCPSLLATELKKLHRRPEVWISHLKPGEFELTMSEIETLTAEFRPKMLLHNQIFDF